MAGKTIPRARDAQTLASLLDSPEIAALVADLEETRWTGRPGYPTRAMVGMCLVKALHALPTWTRTVRLVEDHAALRWWWAAPRPSTPTTAFPRSSGRTPSS